MVTPTETLTDLFDVEWDTAEKRSMFLLGYLASALDHGKPITAYRFRHACEVTREANPAREGGRS